MLLRLLNKKGNIKKAATTSWQLFFYYICKGFFYQPFLQITYLTFPQQVHTKSVQFRVNND